MARGGKQQLSADEKQRLIALAKEKAKTLRAQQQEQVSRLGGDPEKPIQEQDTDIKLSAIGEDISDFIASGTESLAFGNVPRITASLEEIGEFLGLGEEATFAERVKREEEKIAQRKARSPRATTSGDIAGILATALIPAGAIAKGIKIGPPAENILGRVAQFLTRTGKAGAAGAALGGGFGALQAPTQAPESLSGELQARGQQAIRGAETGAIVGGALSVATSALQPVLSLFGVGSPQAREVLRREPSKALSELIKSEKTRIREAEFFVKSQLPKIRQAEKSLENRIQNAIKNKKVKVDAGPLLSEGNPSIQKTIRGALKGAARKRGAIKSENVSLRPIENLSDDIKEFIRRKVNEKGVAVPTASGFRNPPQLKLSDGERIHLSNLIKKSGAPNPNKLIRENIPKTSISIPKSGKVPLESKDALSITRTFSSGAGFKNKDPGAAASIARDRQSASIAGNIRESIGEVAKEAQKPFRDFHELLTRKGKIKTKNALDVLTPPASKSSPAATKRIANLQIVDEIAGTSLSKRAAEIEAGNLFKASTSIPSIIRAIGATAQTLGGASERFLPALTTRIQASQELPEVIEERRRQR